MEANYENIGTLGEGWERLVVLVVVVVVDV